MSAHHSTRMQSPFKTVLGKIGDKYQDYCTTYKTHAMATHHWGTGHPWDRGIDLNAKDPESTDIDNESTHISDATVPLGGLEAEGHPKDTVYSSCNKLMALTREINDLCQWVEAPPPPPTPNEPFGELIWQYTNILCTTQKQTNLTNSLLQDIAVFNKHNSTKLEEWLTDIETAADLTNES